MFAYGNFFTSLLHAFREQVQIEVYFIIKFLMDSKYTWNIFLQIIFQIIFQLFSFSN